MRPSAHVKVKGDGAVPVEHTNTGVIVSTSSLVQSPLGVLKQADNHFLTSITDSSDPVSPEKSGSKARRKLLRDLLRQCESKAMISASCLHRRASPRGDQEARRAIEGNR